VRHRGASGARQDDPGQVAAQMRYLRAILPRGDVQLMGPHHLRQQLRRAEASAGGYRLLEPAR